MVQSYAGQAQNSNRAGSWRINPLESDHCAKPLRISFVFKSLRKNIGGWGRPEKSTQDNLKSETPMSEMLVIVAQPFLAVPVSVSPKN
jgi:hypothetical protein